MFVMKSIFMVAARNLENPNASSLTQKSVGQTSNGGARVSGARGQMSYLSPPRRMIFSADAPYDLFLLADSTTNSVGSLAMRPYTPWLRPMYAYVAPVGWFYQQQKFFASLFWRPLPLVLGGNCPRPPRAATANIAIMLCLFAEKSQFNKNLRKPSLYSLLTIIWYLPIKMFLL
jgi:hypothetical protein